MDQGFSPKISQSAIAQKPLVLAVDDNEDNLALMTFSLDLLGFRFISAMDGESAIALAQTSHPDLILLDFTLPDLNGLEVVSRLKQDWLTKKIPIIAVTAMARTEDRELILSAGCAHYLCKPYIIDELEAIILPYLQLQSQGSAC